MLKAIEEPIGTTISVLMEAFHLLAPASVGARRLMDFITDGGMTVWTLDDASLSRAFELMIQYSDHPMDLPDASLVATAENERLKKVFTIDRNDFTSYRIKRGYRYYNFEVIG